MAASSAPRRRRDPKERLKRSLPALLLVCAVVFLGGALVQIDSVSPGRIDSNAANKIRKLCSATATCTVRLADLIPGDWDTFYEFSPAVSRAEIDTVLKDQRIRTAPRQRVIVLMQNGHLLRRQYAHTGQSQPLAGELVFSATHANTNQSWVVFPPDTSFRVTACETREGGSAFGKHGGTYFLLTPEGTGSAIGAPCLPSGNRV